VNFEAPDSGVDGALQESYMEVRKKRKQTKGGIQDQGLANGPNLKH